MTPFYQGLLLGLFLGAWTGIALMCVLAVAKRADERIEKLIKK